MAKARRKRQNEQPKQKADVFARLLQVIGLIGVIAMSIVDAMVDTAEIPIYVTLGVLGLAIGFSTEQFKDIIKAFIGRK